MVEESEVDAARACVQSLAQSLGLTHGERRSYLELLREGEGKRFSHGPNSESDLLPYGSIHANGHGAKSPVDAIDAHVGSLNGVVQIGRDEERGGHDPSRSVAGSQINVSSTGFFPRAVTARAPQAIQSVSVCVSPDKTSNQASGCRQT